MGLVGLFCLPSKYPKYKIIPRTCEIATVDHSNERAISRIIAINAIWNKEREKVSETAESCRDSGFNFR